MPKFKGRQMLLRIGDGQTTEVFSPLAGLTAKSLTINNSEIDVTTADPTTPGGVMWAEVLDGVKRISVSGSATFLDEASELRLQTVAFSANPFATFEIIVPAFFTFRGRFIIQNLEYSGDVDGAVTYSLSLASDGVVTATTLV